MTFLRSHFFYTTFALYALAINFLFVSIDSEAKEIPTLKNQAQNSILYEVSGNGLTQPSYIFGTIHILNQSYIDSFPVINQKFSECKQMIGEIKFDSTTQIKMASAGLLQGTTLKKVLSKKLYSDADSFLKSLAPGYSLSLFDNYNPMIVNVTLLQLMIAKYQPSKSGDMIMDLYFQSKAKKTGMQVLGFESIDDQINALFNQFSIERQAELLEIVVNDQNKQIADLHKMITLYRNYQLDELASLMNDETYKISEIKILVSDRNNAWLKQLPEMMKSAPSFVAVGAMHLAGEDGLINQLKKMGYTVTPISISN